MTFDDGTRTALITGASSGIGRACALALAERGYQLGIGYRADADGAAATAKAAAEFGVRTDLVQLDLAEPEAAAAAVEDFAGEAGRLDVLVNNAGVNRRAAAVEENLADWRRVLDIDLTGPFACAQVAARRMVAAGRGGRIVNVSSVHDSIPIRGGSAYCAAKSALSMVTQVMALELAPHGITVNAVSPGETATPMNGVPEDLDAASIARPAIPVGRPGRASEVAAAVAFLAGDEAAYITGVALTIDGGLMLMAAIANQEFAGRL